MNEKNFIRCVSIAHNNKLHEKGHTMKVKNKTKHNEVDQIQKPLLPCLTCDKQFKRDSFLERHNRICGLNNRHSLSCLICEKKFISERNLEIDNNRKCCLICAVCKKVCYRIGDYKRHLFSHTEEKPFGCGECNMTFRSKSNLVGHEKIHSGTLKPYNCSHALQQHFQTYIN